MGRNSRRPKRMSVITSRAMHFGAVIVAFFVMVIVNMLASSSGRQLMKSIGEKERQLVKLEDDKTRASARWEEMKTPERLEKALRDHGLSMGYPKASQIVRMTRDGRPRPGQPALARAGQGPGVVVAAAAGRRQGGAVASSRYRKVRR